MDTHSHWIDSASLPRFPRVEKSLQVDVVIIGGGITGITAAYLLKRSGRTVALLERTRCAQIDTGHTTAHVTAVTDLRLHEIARRFGRDAVKTVWDAGGAAIDQIVNLIRAEDIVCDFQWVPGYLHAPRNRPPDDELADFKRDARLARELGISATLMEAVPFVGRPGLQFPQQALFHPRKYLARLIQRIPGRGSHVFENSEVSEVQEKPLAVKVGNNSIRCRYIVMATHNPLMGIAGVVGAAMFQTKLALYTSYALGARIAHDTLPLASYWDTNDPYDYLRIERRRGHDFAIFGGEDHKTGQGDPVAAYRRLEARFLRLVPTAKVESRWSGQVIETNDGLPFIGEMAEKQFAATGFAGNGMTFGTLGGMMAADAALGRSNPWSGIFAPGRKQLRGGTWNVVKENVDYPYYLLRDWIGGAEGKSLRGLRRGRGKILQLGGRKVAAYRNEKGAVTLLSPVCTHLKCIVGWNPAESTWDCPCHGSRFRPTGEVISGPAEEPLARMDENGES